MAYNEDLAQRIRAQFKFFDEQVSEKKMFGGLAFLYKGKMTVGIIKDELVVRVISEKMDVELNKPYVRPMDFTRKPMKEFIYVSEEGLKDELSLLFYIELGLEHARTKL